MKAWFLTGPNEIKSKEVEEPVLQEGYVKLEVLTFQPSITEVNMAACEGDPFGITDRVKAGEDVRLPGHEFCGRVIETNNNSKFKVGDRVASLAKISCGECPMCRAGFPRLCVKAKLLGINLDGIFAEKVIIPENGLALVPEELTNSEAANLQPLADCVAAVESANIKLGDTVVIFGAGCLGLNIMQVARASGAGKLIVVDVRDEALEISKQLGANYVINGLKEDPVKVIKSLTGGIGADVIFEAAGGNPKKGMAGTVALVQATQALKPDGNLVIVAIYGPSVEIPIGDIRNNGKIVICPKLSTVAHLKHAAALIATGQLQVKPIVNYQLEGFDQLPKAFEITGDKSVYNVIMPAQVHVKQ